MRKLIFIFFFLTGVVFADDTIPFKTGTGHAKVSPSGIGTASKPYNFTDVTVTGISGGGGGAPGGLDKQVQYKNVTAFGGIPTLTYDGGTSVLTLAAGANFNMVDPTDLTKKLRITLSGITTGTTRTFTPPNADFTGVIPTTLTSNQFVQYISSGGTQFKAQPTDAMLSTSDITTNNVSITKHGFAPKAPNDATMYLDGTGAYSVPAGAGGSPGGSTTQFQYNNAGAFAGTDKLVISSGVVNANSSFFSFTDVSDPTKKIQFALSNVPTGTTRTIIVPTSASPVVVGGLSVVNHNFVTNIGTNGTQNLAQPSFTDMSDSIAAAQNNIPVGNTLYVDAVNGNNTTALTNRFDKPYATLNGVSGAIADAASGDMIVLGPGTFTESGAVSPPQNVALLGSGAGITAIVTTGGIKPATGDKLADFTIDARTGSNSSASFAIGLDTADTAATDVTISGVELLGNTDGFYFNKAGIDRVYIYDSSVTTTFDTVFTGNMTGTVSFANCVLTADGSIGGAAIVAGIDATSGTTNFHGGTITLNNGVLDARGVRARNSGTRVSIHGTEMNVTATTAFDLHQASSAVLAIDSVVRLDDAALVKSGTITNTVSTYEGNLGLTDITTGNVSITKHGFAPKAPNDATKYLDGTGAYSVPAGGGSSLTPGTGIDITTGTISVSPGVIDDQLEDTTPTLDDFMLTLDTTGSILEKVSLTNLADNLSIDSVTDDSSGFAAVFDTSALTANRNVFFPDNASTTVAPSLRSTAGNIGKTLTGIGTDGGMTWGYDDISTTAQFTSNQNDFTPANPTIYLKLSTDGTRNLTGIVGSGTDGETKYIICTGNSLVIKNEDSGSTAANRFHNSTGTDITLGAAQMAMITYNTNLSRWLGNGPLGASSVAAGSNTYMQYNNSGVLGGVSTLKYNGSQVTQQAGTSYALLDSSDNTKKAVFDLSNITTGTSRTINVPDAANSVLVIGGSATSNSFVTNITTGGVQTVAQPSVSNLSSSTSASLRTVLSDENGTGAALFDSSTSATFITPILGTPTSGTLTNCTGGGGYTMNGGTMGVTISPADSTTYYFGYGESNTTAQKTTIANAQMIVPKTGTITRIHFQPFIITNGTNESVSHFLRLNNTTDTTLSTSETYDPGANTVKSFSYTGLSIAVTAGDTIAFKITTPAWATNPTIGSCHIMIWIE